MTMIGEWRPNVLSWCNPDPVKAAAANAECAAKGIAYCPVYRDICQSEMPLSQGRSFVSGHAGFILAAYIYLSLWFLAKTKISTGRSRSLFKFAVPSILICGALIVGLTRIMTGHHHWWNVVLGDLVGIFAGCLSYYMYWPSPLSACAHSPISMYEREGELNADNNTWSTHGRLLLLIQNNFRISNEARTKAFLEREMLEMKKMSDVEVGRYDHNI
eukprot:g6515.t1